MIVKKVTLSDHKSDLPGVYYEKVATFFDATIVYSYFWSSKHGYMTKIVDAGHIYRHFVYTRIKRRN